MASALTKLVGCLKCGGKLLFRDYGRLDMAQLRIKPGDYCPMEPVPLLLYVLLLNHRSMSSKGQLREG